MAQYKDVIVNAGAGGFGGPLVLKPDDKRIKLLILQVGLFLLYLKNCRINRLRTC